MDERLAVHDPPRPEAPGVSADLPLATVAWRFLRSQYRRKAQEEKDRRRSFLALAEAVLKLRSLAAGLSEAPAKDEDPLPKELARIGESLGEELARLGLTILSPQGEPYDARLMELFDSIARKPVAGIPGPVVGEVVAPAVVHDGAVLKMGKAVIHVPVGDVLEGLSLEP